MNARRFLELDPGRRYERGDAARIAAARALEDHRWRRARSIGIIGTVLLHFLVLILFRQTDLPTSSVSSAAGPPAGDVRAAAGGGSGLTMVEVRPAQAPPQEEVPVPVPTPVPEEIVIEPEEVEVSTPDPEPLGDPVPSLPGVGQPGTGGQDGQATGPGTATGTGDGAGGGGDQGAAQIIPPRPRGIFIPPSGPPSSARGQEITVWVFVRETGRVDENTIRLEPPTGDSRYDRRLIQSVAEWVFDPATQEGRAVPVWYPFQIIL